VKVVGLTGGVGAGKSEVARVWAAQGAVVLEADRFGHLVLAEDPGVRRALAARFGSSVLDRKGHVVRAEVSRLAFASKRNLQALNRIVGRPLVERLHREVSRLRRRKGGVLVVDAALLCEWQSPLPLDVRVLVTAPRSLRLKWLSRRGLSYREAAKRMAHQWPDARKRKWADVEIRNTGSLTGLRRQARALWHARFDSR
jgi:dephospho-CoA kinase